MRSGAWDRRSHRLRPTGWGLDIDQSSSGRYVRPARGYRRRLIPHRHRRHGIHHAGAAVIARTRRCSPPADERSPRFERGHAGVVARGGVCSGATMKTRSESYRRSWSRRPSRLFIFFTKPAANGGLTPGAVYLRHACARCGFRRGQGRPDLANPRHPPGRRVSRLGGVILLVW